MRPYHDWISSITQLGRDQIEVVNVADGEKLPTTIEASGIIGGGSAHAAFENHQWIRDAGDFLRAAQRQGVPQLHFCWSHQLKAISEGGAVARGERGRRFGVERLRLTPDGRRDPLFTGLPAEFDVYTSHTDVITTLPVTGRIRPVELARGSVYPYEALAYGPNVRTLQTHPEFTADTIATLARARRRQLVREGIVGPSDEDLDDYVADLRAQYHKVRKNSLKLVENWVCNIMGPAHLRGAYEADLAMNGAGFPNYS